MDIDNKPLSEAPNAKPQSQLLTPQLLWTMPVIVILAANGLYLLQLLMGTHVFQLIKNVYFFNTIVFPAFAAVLGTLGIIAAVQDHAKRPLLRASIANLAIAALFFGARVWCTHIEPHRAVLRRETVALGKSIQPLRILHISDTQSRRVGAYEERVFQRIGQIQADLILHTGDFLQPMIDNSWESEWPKLEALIQTLDPPLGIYGIQGDVDVDFKQLAGQRTLPLRILENESAEIAWHDARIRLYGLGTSESRRPDYTQVEAWLNQAQPNDINILLGHAPDYILSLSDLPIDLCLAGHTHGGQVRVPFYGPLITLSAVPRHLARGLHTVGQTRLNVSAGMGSEHMLDLPAIRFNCPTEMSLIEITP